MSAAAHVREAAEEDLHAVLRVQRACAEAPQWNSAQYEKMLQSNAARSRRVAFVAEEDGLVVGYVVASCAAGEAELENIAVLPEARRRGLARALCGAALAWAASAGAGEMWLEVRSASEGAQSLYRQLGFEQTGVRKRYYAHPEDDAVLMRANPRQAGHL